MRILQIDNYDHCCFCNHDSKHFSILRVSANALYDYYSRIFDLFIFIDKSNRFFFLVKGYCVYMINKIIHGCLQIQNFSSLAQLEEKFHICARPCIILYISGTFRNPYHQIITLVSRALLGIPFIRLLPQYLSHFWNFFHSIVLLVTRALLGLSFIRLLRLYLAHFKDSLSLDYHVSISCTFRILFHWIVAFVSLALLGFSFMRLPRQYLAHLQDSPSFDYYISISRNFRILFHWMTTLVP